MDEERVAPSGRPGGAVLVIARSLRRGNSDRDCFAPLAMKSGLLGDRTRLHAMDLRFRLLGGLIVERHQLAASQGHRGVRATLVVGKLNLEHVRTKHLDDRADLAAAQAMLGHVFHQRHHIQQFDLRTHN